MVKKNVIRYIGISIMMSSVIYAIFQMNFKAAIILAALFFCISFIFMVSDYYVMSDRKNLIKKIFKGNVIAAYCIFVITFFIIGIINNNIYYTVKDNSNFKGIVRINKKCTSSYIGNYNGRNIFVIGNFKENPIGERYYISGEFKKQIDFEYGNIGMISVGKYEKLDDDFFTKIYRFKKYIFDRLKENIGQRKAALVSSLSYGYSDLLDNEDREDMKNLGVIHAISVSGLHVVLVYGVISKILGKRSSLIITCIYVIFTGAQFSSIRAFIMISLKVLAVHFRKKYNPLSALLFSSIVITMYKPYSVFNLGFILSFLAVTGIILFYKLIEHRLFRLPAYLRESIALSVSASAFTVPILIYSFSQISYLSIIGNIIIVPILELIIKIGNLIIIFVNIPAVFDFICFILMKIIYILDYILNIASSYNKSLMVSKEFCILYILVIITLFFYKKGFRKLKILPIATMIGIMICFYSPFIQLNYLEKGTFIISYRGSRKIFSTSSNFKAYEEKSKNMADESFRKPKSIKMKNIIIESDKSNYVMKFKGRKYLIVMNDKNQYKHNNNQIYYDIIDFINKKSSGFFVIGDKIVKY